MLLISILLPALGASNGAWQAGRIVEVQKNVKTKTLTWLVNTPITQDETTYLVSVHVQDKIFTGMYELGKVQGPPPETWVKDRAVRVQIDGDTMYLQGPNGSEFKLNILKKKSAAIMQPVTAKELAEAETAPAVNPDEALTGFIPPTKAAPAAQQPSAAKPALAPEAAPAVQPTGVINVHTSPYLADIYVDGENMGYTPAKLTLPPGKHTVRFEKQGCKSWSKEITLTAGSELLVDATLEKK